VSNICKFLSKEVIKIIVKINKKVSSALSLLLTTVLTLGLFMPLVYAIDNTSDELFSTIKKETVFDKSVPGANESEGVGTGLITGKVLVEGEDLEKPVIVHEQEVTESYLGSNIEIVADISDDISIVETELLVRTEGECDWKAVQMTRVSGDHKYGTYKAIITYDMLGEPGIIYKIRAEDYDGKEEVTGEYSIDIIFGIVPGEYETDFETEPVGWTLTGDWEWGKPGEGVGPEPYSGARLVGTVLDNKYSRNSDSYLIIPPMDLRDATLESATLRFYQWYEINNSADRHKGQIYISDDFENWISIGQEYTGYAKTWKEILIDLKDYIGSPTPVSVACHFMSDNARPLDGWYIDDVRLVGNDTEPPAILAGVIAEITSLGIKISWNSSPEADLDKYTVYRSNTSDGEYIAISNGLDTSFLDETAKPGNSYYYVVTATDIFGNESGYSEEVFATAPGIITIFSTDFEEDEGGFMTGKVETGSYYKNCWEWGKPISGPGEALTGTKLWATNLAGKYDSNSRGYIKSPPIEIPENIIATLYFDHWIESETIAGWPNDYGAVEISDDDGKTWHDVVGRLGEAEGNGKWERKEISLADYAGKTIQVRFCFYSNYAKEYDGWYIDNVLVSGTAAAEDATSVSVAESIVEKHIEERFGEDKQSKEGHIKPQRPKFGLIGNKTSDYEVTAAVSVENTTAGNVPADAVVTITETGKSVKTDPATGKFFMEHAANTAGEMWTLHAQSYGYYPKEIKIHLEEDGKVDETIILDAIPQGVISGKIFDEYDNAPIPDAVISLKEDLRIAPVKTDTDGNFKLENVLEGTYTLKVKADWFYELKETEVAVIGNRTKEIEVPLKKSIKYEDEIAYDCGSPKDALVMENASDGTAVRVTPDQYGKVKAANIYFWGDEWPEPGGTEIGIAIFDSDIDGKPVEMIAEPKIVNINRGEWNTIDLSEYNFATNRDFYIATVQTQARVLSPGIGLAGSFSSGGTGRSYIHTYGKSFMPLADAGGNVLMIRALMEYSANTPEITNLKEINYTNQDKITVEGKMATEGKINIYVNAGKAAELETENKVFSVEIDLEQDESIITATSELNGVETDPVVSVKVLKDKTSPILEITKPLDGDKINAEVLHVEGKAVDEHFDKLLINNKETEVNEDGNFHGRLIVVEGENIITVEAIDLAGNRTIKTRKITVKLEGEPLENIEPAGDITLKTGGVLTVSFNAETGGKGSFRVKPEMLPDVVISGDLDTWVPMEENRDHPGLYVGNWIIPAGFAIVNGVVEIKFIDMAGNKTEKTAPGTITVVPTSQWRSMENLPPGTVIIGKKAFDIRYLNSNVGVQRELIDRYKQRKEIYIKSGEDTIVNIRGIAQGLDVLPEEITYYDVNGDTIFYVK
jgi:hypothetical protein